MIRRTAPVISFPKFPDSLDHQKRPYARNGKVPTHPARPAPKKFGQIVQRQHGQHGQLFGPPMETAVCGIPSGVIGVARCLCCLCCLHYKLRVVVSCFCGATAGLWEAAAGLWDGPARNSVWAQCEQQVRLES